MQKWRRSFETVVHLDDEKKKEKKKLKSIESVKMTSFGAFYNHRRRTGNVIPFELHDRMIKHWNIDFYSGKLNYTWKGLIARREEKGNVKYSYAYTGWLWGREEGKSMYVLSRMRRRGREESEKDKQSPLGPPVHATGKERRQWGSKAPLLLPRF